MGTLALGNRALARGTLAPLLAVEPRRPTLRPVRSAVLVVNLLAPRAGGTAWRDLVAAALGDAVELLELQVRGFDEARAAARAAAESAADLLVVVGGDGTVNACANGLGHAPVPMAVIPAGTANDLARLLDQDCLPRSDARALGGWTRRTIDALQCNSHRFHTVGGIGWVADVAATANRWRTGSGLRRRLMALAGSRIYEAAAVATIA